MRVRLRTVVVLLGVLVVAGAVGGALVARGGWYDVAATAEHTAPVYHFLKYAMRHSVAEHSEGIRVPTLDAARARRGFAHYRDYCVQCHGGPGVAPDRLAGGLMPEPANLVAAARDWPTRELFWTVKHGLKMTAMPSWDFRMSDDEIWDLVAFLREMPSLSPQDYARMGGRAEKHFATREASTPPAGPGDPQAGRREIHDFMCDTCHRIPGITGADRDVGPPLDGIGTRRFIAGVLANTRENMVRWLRDPQDVDPLTAMPDLGVSEQEARDIAAYLAQLKEVE